MMLNRYHLLIVALGCGLVFIPASGLIAQQTDKPPAQAPPANGQNQEVDPLKRERSDKEKFAAQKAVRQELKGAYKTWLDQDVPYIISDEERKAFKNLSNDEERDAFIEQFWLRRNPNPDSPENEFREEHYRRIAYANEHFAAGKPGWKTDRGHIYISFGPADSIDSHPSGGNYERPMEEGGGETSTFPFEVWHYRYLEGIGENIDLEFVDTCQCGDYHFTIDRSEKDALLHVPGAGLTQYEQMGKAKKADRFKGGMESLGTGPGSQGQESKEFDRIELAAKIFAPPPIKFKDLEAFISEHKLLTGPVFPFDVRTDFIKVTENTDLVPITLQMKNRDITFVTKDGVSKGVVNILGKVTTITHKTVQTFEDTVEVEQPAELLEKIARPPVGLLEGSAPAARPLPSGHCHQGREQPGPHWHLRACPERADVPRRKAGHLHADSGRPDEPGEFTLHRQRQFCYRQHLYPPPREQPQPGQPNPRSNSSATRSSISGCRSTTWASTRPPRATRPR